MIKNVFTNYIKATNLTGSQKANSYIKALDILSSLIKHEPYGFNDCKDIWKNDYYTSNSVKEYFIKKQGMKINLPNTFKPNKNFLEIHRNNCCL